MAVTFRYLASPAEQKLVLDWFLQRPENPEFQALSNGGGLVHFASFGPLLADLKRSPVVSHFPPRERRGLFWTPGEVHFLTQHVRGSFPELHRVQMAFHGWLRSFPIVYQSSHRRDSAGSPWEHFLEGSIRNWDTEIYALPEAMAALEQGRYFVDGKDSEVRLDDLVRVLRLRGVFA